MITDRSEHEVKWREPAEARRIVTVCSQAEVDYRWQGESASGRQEESQPLQANGHRSFASAGCDGLPVAQKVGESAGFLILMSQVRVLPGSVCCQDRLSIECIGGTERKGSMPP